MFKKIQIHLFTEWIFLEALQHIQCIILHTICTTMYGYCIAYLRVIDACHVTKPILNTGAVITSTAATTTVASQHVPMDKCYIQWGWHFAIDAKIAIQMRLSHSQYTLNQMFFFRFFCLSSSDSFLLNSNYRSVSA